MDINTILFALLVIMIAGYAILDGFDLGVGTLSLFAQSNEERDLNVASIGPVWDGNQVWLLATGNVLFSAFPLVFSTILSAFYIPFVLLLVALIARALPMEFRHMHPSSRWVRFWDRAMGVGSLSAAILLGVAMGNVLRGLPIGPDFAWKGGFLGLLNPYSLLIGILSCSLFIMHGAVYSWMKTEGELSERYNRIALGAFRVFLSLYGVAAVATAYVSPTLFPKTGNLGFWAISMLLVLALASIPFAIRAGRKGAAFFASSATIALMIVVTALSAHPVIVPSLIGPDWSLTIYNAASTPRTLTMMLIIASIGMPIMLAYTIAIYRVFRGPARAV